MKKTEIRTTRVLHPQIYAWYTPDIPKYKNWVKIGYTTRTAEQRIKEQASQIIIDKKELWHYDARFMNGQGYFDDHDLHDYLTRIKQIPREKGSEWFDYTPDMMSVKQFQNRITSLEMSKQKQFFRRSPILIKVGKNFFGMLSPDLVRH